MLPETAYTAVRALATEVGLTKWSGKTCMHLVCPNYASRLCVFRRKILHLLISISNARSLRTALDLEKEEECRKLGDLDQSLRDPVN